MDTRILDVFFRCPREYLLNYNLYEYFLQNFCEKKLLDIPFHSAMMKYVENFKSAVKDTTKLFGSLSKCNYKMYLEKQFSPILFKGTFLAGLSNVNASKIPEPFLHRICDLNSFLLGLKNR